MEFQDISFAYNKGEEILKEINFTLNPAKSWHWLARAVPEKRRSPT